jgi:transcriptional regulator with XRE-family HTH domain
VRYARIPVLLRALIEPGLGRTLSVDGSGLCQSSAPRESAGEPADPCTDRSCFRTCVGRSVEDVDRRKDIQEFLTSRRARLTPEQAGLARFGDRRRVTGLRREEVAMLAGVSMDYYARLERGHLTGASESVLEAVARALQLDEAERQHLLDLARNSEITMSRPPRRPKPSAATPRPAVMAILAGMTGIPAYVRTPRMEIVAANELCQALYGGVLDDGQLPLNLARYLFLDPHSRGFFLDWDAVADDLIGALRVQAGRDPRDRALSDLIGELSTRSDDFVARWARQNVRLHRTARKRLHNRVVGEIELTGNALELPGDDLILIAYTADPGSQAEDQLKLLVTWAASEKPATTRPDPAQPSPSHD